MSSCGAGSSSQGAAQRIKPRVSRSTSSPPGATMINQEPQVARTAFVMNDALREKVRHLAGLGVPQDDIAKIVGCAGEAVPQRMRRHSLPDPGGLGGGVDGAVELTGRKRLDRVAARKQPAPRQQYAAAP